jgi:hypothetical protein
MSKRVYKYLTAEYALDDLDKGRLKVSTVDELNDPFDLAAFDTTHPEADQVYSAFVQHFRKTAGLLCFSRNWDNILLWSHYGFSHTGVCLGFDIPSDGQYDMDILYQSSIPPVRSPQDISNEDFVNRVLRTKFTVWSYEQELRMLVSLIDAPDENGLHWFDFGENLLLKEVIVGAQCSPENSRRAAQFRLRYGDTVEFSWAGLRHEAFSLVKNAAPPRWQA